jgi:hypothetical protein
MVKVQNQPLNILKLVFMDCPNIPYYLLLYF